MEKRGSLIVFEGIDGSGKSTQIRLLAERLRQTGTAFYVTMEPTDSPIGSLINQIMTGRVKADPRVIAALFAADRLDHLLNDVNGIKSKIDGGTAVIMDRYYFSSYAYQSVDAPLEWVIQSNALSSDILRPAVNIFIDTDPDAAWERISENRFQKELFEEKSRLMQVRKRYMEAFERLKDEECVAFVDGNRSREEVAEDVYKIVKDYLAAE